jgi:pSer/pThr/pTyr-binding forkhead associated (FHA) protein
MSVLAAPAAALRLRTGPWAGQIYELRGALRIGRHPYNDVSLPDPAVSRYHCWIVRRDGEFWIEDLASANGTFVDGERVAVPRALRPGAAIRVGATEFEFTGEEA